MFDLDRYRWLNLGTTEMSHHNPHVNYESSITFHSKVMASVKDFFRTNGHTDRAKNVCPASINAGGGGGIKNVMLQWSGKAALVTKSRLFVSKKFNVLSSNVNERISLLRFYASCF